MENTIQPSNTLSSPSITNDSLFGDSASLGETSDHSWGFWSILGMSLFIILVLAIAGFNLFSYLAVGTQDAANWFEAAANKIKEYTGNLPIGKGLGNVVGVSALGTRDIIDATSENVNAVSTGIDKIAEKVLDPIIERTVHLNSTNTTPSNSTENNSLNRALNTQQALSGGLVAKGASANYNADDSTSTIQKTTNKGGWCFIGENNGARTCALVSENQQCMSGDIFPTNDICINPNLRP